MRELSKHTNRNVGTIVRDKNIGDLRQKFFQRGRLDMQTAKTRVNQQFEYIRAFASIAVITIHTVYSALLQFGDTATMTEKLSYRIVMNLMWWAVPCFLMMTGSLLLDSNRIISIKKLYGKYVSRMILVLFTFGLAFSWLELFFDSRTISLMQIPRAMLNICTGNTWAHMWYIYCLIGLYVLLPVYKLIADHASDTQLKYLLFILFIFESALRLTKIIGVNLGFYCHINTIYPFWLLMGAAWNRGMFKRDMRFNGILLAVSSGILVLASALAVTKNVPLNSLFGYDSVVVVAQSVALFSLLNAIHTDIKLNKVLTEIGDKSFGIYLIHMFFINMAYKILKFNPFATRFAVGGALIVINLVLSYIVVSIMKRLPGFKKII